MSEPQKLCDLLGLSDEQRRFLDGHFESNRFDEAQARELEAYEAETERLRAALRAAEQHADSERADSYIDGVQCWDEGIEDAEHDVGESRRRLRLHLWDREMPPADGEEIEALMGMVQKALTGTLGGLAKRNAELWQRGSVALGRGTEGLVNPETGRPIGREGRGKSLPGVRNPDQPTVPEMRLLRKVLQCVPGRQSG